MLVDGFGVNLDLQIIVYLSQHSGERISQTELCKRLSSTNSWTLKCRKKLSKLGLLVVEHDGRKNILGLSKDGKKVAGYLLSAKSYFVKNEVV